MKPDPLQSQHTKRRTRRRTGQEADAIEMNIEKLAEPKRPRKRRKAAEATSQPQQDPALLLWESGSREQAVAELESTVEAMPNRADLWCRLGEFYDALGSEALLQNDQPKADRQREKAVAALTEAITLSPQFAKAHFALANVYWGRDFREALVALEAAAKYGPDEYAGVLEQARTTVRECTYQLARMNVIVLGSAQEMPSSRMLEAEFFFAEFRIGCAVMHTRVSDKQRQLTHVWLFESEHPDLNVDQPVAELIISSAGDVSISAGCPANYHATKGHASQVGILAGWLGTNGPPALYGSPAGNVVEDTRTRVPSERAGHPTATVPHPPSHRRSTAAASRGAPEGRSVPAPTRPFAASQIFAQSRSPDAQMGGLLTPAEVEVLREQITPAVTLSAPRSSRRLLWKYLGPVLIAAAAIAAAAAAALYLKDFEAAHTLDKQTGLAIAAPGLLPPAASDAPAARESPGELVLLTAEAPMAASSSKTAAPFGSPTPPRPAPSASPTPLRPAPSASPTPSRPAPSASPTPLRPAPSASPTPLRPAPSANPPSPSKQPPRKTIDPQPRPDITQPAATEAQVTVFEPPRPPAPKEPIVAEAKPAPQPPPAAENPGARLRRDLAQCAKMGFVQRGLCMERTRWNYCHPDNWDKISDCRVR